MRSLRSRKCSCLVSSFVAAFQSRAGGILLENTPHLTVWGWEQTLLVWSPPSYTPACPLNAKHPPKPSTHNPSPEHPKHLQLPSLSTALTPSEPVLAQSFLNPVCTSHVVNAAQQQRVLHQYHTGCVQLQDRCAKQINKPSAHTWEL